MKKISLVLLILSLAVALGCSSQETPSIGDVTCNADTIGTQVPDKCNTCTCTESNGDYGWACTEIGCNAMPFT